MFPTLSPALTLAALSFFLGLPSARADDRPLVPATVPATMPAAPRVDPDLSIQFLPSTIQLSDTIHLRGAGTRDVAVKALVHIQPHGLLAPLAEQNLRVSRAVTDDGQEVLFRFASPGVVLHDWAWQREATSIAVTMNFPAPDRTAKKIAQLTGTLEIGYATGARQETVVEPLSDFLGKEVPIKNTAHWVRLTRQRPGETTLECDSGLTSFLYAVTLYDAAGKPLRIPGWQDGGHFDKARKISVFSRTLLMDLPDNARVVLETYPKNQLHAKLVTFTLTDLPLTQGKDLMPAPPVEGVVTDEPDPPPPQPMEIHIVP